MCDHTIAGEGTLICQRTDTHDPQADANHIYYATWASDDHDRAEADR